MFDSLQVKQYLISSIINSLIWVVSRVVESLRNNFRKQSDLRKLGNIRKISKFSGDRA